MNLWLERVSVNTTNWPVFSTLSRRFAGLVEDAEGEPGTEAAQREGSLVVGLSHLQS